MITHELQLLRDTAQASFWQRFAATVPIIDGLIDRVDSNSDQETYPGLSYAPRPRVMEGSRTHRSVPSFSFTIVNSKFESTVDISYEMWKYGRLGAVQALIANMGAKAKNHPSRLVADLINAGSVDTGHDGQIFFSNAHVDAGARNTTAQDNDFTTNINDETAATVLEMYTMLQAHRSAYDTFLDGEGDPVIPTPDEVLTVLVPGGHMPAARAVFMNDQITGPISNDMKGIFKPVLNPYGDDADEVFTFRTAGERKPFIHQVAEDVSLTDNIGGDSDFETKDVSIGTFSYQNVGYGDWRFATREIFT